MPDATVLGMPLVLLEDDWLNGAQPLEALVLVKVIDQDGDVVYLENATAGLSGVEALGMLRKAQLRMEHKIMGPDREGD